VMKLGPVGPSRGILLAYCLIFGLVGADDTLLTSLPKSYASSKWIKFVEERKNDYEQLAAYLKAPKKEKDERSSPAVVKVLARCRLPVRSLLDTFQSKNEEILAEWNQFAGEVTYIDKTVQLQTYSLPWPFMPRDYLVRCTDRVDKAGHTAHCSSVESDARAPEREGAVRGRSETVWRFREEKDGMTSIHLETLVDPRGRLPAWLVDKAGKLASVSVVRSLVRTTSSRLTKANAASAGIHADGGSPWASVRRYVGRLVWG